LGFPPLRLQTLDQTRRKGKNFLCPRPRLFSCRFEDELGKALVDGDRVAAVKTGQAKGLPGNVGGPDQIVMNIGLWSGVGPQQLVEYKEEEVLERPI